MKGIPLLDVNVLVALFDPAHPHHEAARAHQSGISNLSETTVEVMRRLETLCASSDHEFWPCQVSLLDSELFRPALIGGSKKVTDVYLLGLAVGNKGRLVTFDRSISTKAIVGAEPWHLRFLGGRATKL